MRGYRRLTPAEHEEHRALAAILYISNVFSDGTINSMSVVDDTTKKRHQGRRVSGQIQGDVVGMHQADCDERLQKKTTLGKRKLDLSPDEGGELGKEQHGQPILKQSTSEEILPKAAPLGSVTCSHIGPHLFQNVCIGFFARKPTDVLPAPNPTKLHLVLKPNPRAKVDTEQQDLREMVGNLAQAGNITLFM